MLFTRSLPVLIAGTLIVAACSEPTSGVVPQIGVRQVPEATTPVTRIVTVGTPRCEPTDQQCTPVSAGTIRSSVLAGGADPMNVEVMGPNPDIRQ